LINPVRMTRQLAAGSRLRVDPGALLEAARNRQYNVPSHLRRRHINLGPEELEKVGASLEANYCTGWRAREHYSEATYQADLQDHVLARIESDRRLIIPWLDAGCGLQGLRILEVGCGTGASTVALAEQGARVTGIDVDTGALQVAADRCRLYGLEAELLELNACEVGRRFKSGDFDLVILFACLEHMTMSERMEALPQLWALLPGGAWLAVVETPNRLWYFDHHTSLLPFFNWLPDELAFAYSRFSEREQFKEDFRVNTPERMHAFLRLGRGVSYHEFDVALGTHSVHSSFSTFYGYRHTLLRSLRAHRHKWAIKSMRPDLHDGWFEPTLYLLMRKETN
jgi:2-polyprenyl-3-methyl-5-hydroxy-6-metoxy-1,4-benzoquinol methylase